MEEAAPCASKRNLCAIGGCSVGELKDRGSVAMPHELPHTAVELLQYLLLRLGAAIPEHRDHQMLGIRALGQGNDLPCGVGTCTSVSVGPYPPRRERVAAPESSFMISSRCSPVPNFIRLCSTREPSCLHIIWKPTQHPRNRQ